MPKNKKTIQRKMSTYERVVSAFDPDLLARICEMDEEEFAGAFDLKVTPTLSPLNGFYAHADNGADVLAVAHLDTVSDRRGRRARFVDTEAGPVVFSRALDDRLGAYVILDLLPKLGISTDILLTVGEEQGESTAQWFESDRQYNWMFEFDRGGSDVVMYQFEDEDLIERVKDSGARIGQGSFSDIAFLDQLNCKGVNWGVGYQDYHSERSHAYLEDTFDMVAKFISFYEENQYVALPHDDSMVEHSWPMAYRGQTFGDPYCKNSWGDEYADYREDDEDHLSVLSEEDIKEGLYAIAQERLSRARF